MNRSIIKLNNRIQVLKPQEEMDFIGGVTTEFIPSFSAWARVQPINLKNGETWEFGSLEYVADYKVWLHSAIEINPNSRVQWKKTLFEIKTRPAFTEDKKYQFFVMRTINSERT
jgi:head-tail adaptor